MLSLSLFGSNDTVFEHLLGALRLNNIKGWYGRIDDRLKSEVLLYVLTFVLAVVLAFVSLELWRADLRIPISPGGDETLVQGVVIRPLVSQWWYLNNPDLSAPSGLHMQDYPTGTDTVHILILKLMAATTRDSAMTVNLFYLFTFPAIALSMLFAARYSRLRRPVALAIALLYAFAPYHFIRGEGHLLLSAYFMLPIGLVVALRVDSILDTSKVLGKRKEYESRSWREVITDRFFAFSCICSVIIAGCGIYYAFFWIFILVATAVRRAILHRRWRSLAVPALLIAVLMVSIMAFSAPTIFYQQQNGPNPVSAGRTALDAEVYALRPVQLLLPMQYHRFQTWMDENQLYGQFLSQVSPVLSNETRFASLGLVAAVGFVFLLGLSVFGVSSFGGATWDKYGLGDLAAINITMLLLGSVGGLGFVIAYRVTPMIRAYNRVSVVIAMVSLLAVGAVVDRFLDRFPNPQRVAVVAGLLLLTIGMFDQTSPRLIPAYAANRAEVGQQKAFAASAQALLPRGSMVFQLPFAPFPDGGYEHLVPYIYSDGLRWSFAAMSGRETANWQAGVAALPAAQMIPQLRAAGFTAIYLDRSGYPDGGERAVTELTALLGDAKVSDADGRRLVWQVTR